MPSPVVVSGQAIGSDIAVANSTDLAALPTQGLALGTTAYNVTTGTSFVLTNSTASLVTDQVVAVSGITGQRWIVQALSFPVATATTPGLMTAAQASALFGSAVPLAVFVASKVDATVGGTFDFIPARAGYYFMLSRFAVFALTVTGTGTVNGSWSVGNNGTSYNNLVSSNLTFATLNAIAAQVPTLAFVNNAGGAADQAMADATTPIKIKVNPTTGFTACLLTFIVEGTWQAI